MSDPDAGHSSSGVRPATGRVRKAASGVRKATSARHPGTSAIRRAVTPSEARTIVIIGGGIIGLSCALRLHQAGHRVTVLDGARGALEASWAAAGMLAPHHEANGPDDLWRLGRAGLDRWAIFAEDLGGGHGLDLRVRGGLIPCITDDEAAALTARTQWMAAEGITVTHLAGDDLRRAGPGLSEEVRFALRLPAAQVNPRLVCEALTSRLTDLGVSVRYDTLVRELTPQGVRLADRLIEADEVVLASGAWSPSLALLAGVDLPGEPVKGQLLRFARGDDLLSSFVHSHHAYLVPRRGLGLVVGATMVQSGFDKSEDPEAIAGLAARARRLLPALAEIPVVETWTGLRPKLMVGGPVIRRQRPGLVIATGHFRNGILLAPITADLVAGIVVGKPGWPLGEMMSDDR